MNILYTHKKYLLLVLVIVVLLTSLWLWSKNNTDNKKENKSSNSSTSSAKLTDYLGNFFYPSATEGPYYPYSSKLTDTDADLTLINGNVSSASGDVIEIRGTLLSDDAKPLKGYTIEIWQADKDGIYNHPMDRKLAERDKNFQGYGEVVTDPNGIFKFKTILPGIYEGRMRHIHFKVVKSGTTIFTSQFLFDQEGMKESDSVYTSMGTNKDVAIQEIKEEKDVDQLMKKFVRPVVRIKL